MLVQSEASVHVCGPRSLSARKVFSRLATGLSSEVVHVILGVFGLLVRWQSSFGTFGHFGIFDEVARKDSGSIPNCSLRKPGSLHRLLETNIALSILGSFHISYKVIVSLLAFEILGAS